MTRLPLARLLLIAGAFMALVQVHRALGAVLANELGARGFDASDIATIVSAMFLAAALFQLPTGMIFDRFGARATMAGLGAIALAGIVVFALSDSVAGLATGRFLIGLGHGGTITGIYLLAVQWVDARKVSTVTGGVIAFAGGVGGLLATAPLGAALAHFGHAATFGGIAVATALVTLAIGAFVRDAPEASARPRVGESFAESLRGLVAVAVERRMWPIYAMGACFSAPFATIGGLWSGPWLVADHGLDRAGAAWVVLAMVAAFHLGHYVYGLVEQRSGSAKWTIVGGACLMLALLAALAAMPANAPLAAAVLLVAFCLCTPFYPVLASHCRAFVPVARVGRAIACVNLVGLSSVFVVQRTSGLLIDAGAGYRAVFALVAALLAVATVAFLRVENRPVGASR